MLNLNQDNITQAVTQTFANTSDVRLHEVITSLVRHLHAFARDVKLTEEEWEKGIEFLKQCGHITDEKRQEFILLSDVLGLSMLVVAMNNDKPVGCTEATVFGPFHVDGAPHYELGVDISNGARGIPCLVQGTVKGILGEPVPGAHIDVWQSDEDGLYDVQYPGLGKAQARGIVNADHEGRFHFRSILAVPYAIPHDGPVGKMLAATGRHPWRPAHLHFLIKAPGYETLITHVFRRDSAYIESDAVFGVRQSLLAEWRELADGTYRLEYDFVLNPSAEMV
ncbi:6-chlorohydroxyquinol-1,2-dioxygenase [Burkholderia pseudomallei MSHR338]|uniref:intradiol ring-cleavage dioxygenase n=1 Tax=Burkholderia pseudomallei TaxID=28450 RepID=UPI0001A48866|nr:intradiol ring-cleavage dioxygenase [Burkholderia pseudomallei]ACQ97669.1 hydroxyquinol 1,2-dioxygenase (1,2-HQD) [Burkholderia pseudomallei MSHR346]AIP11619.1 hydroxyquinol 1,2-dioxygenase [Burkholderia pseudomallei]EQA90420.1 6-chlorohydroxyquinol-1,2-dioxygenase [Burkholderia pseudomallei MSHR338]OMW31611.1 hydroxyquinol 1,2-dioxygenase [Burkholderia pseudomallei]ONA26207.1 hydroxyquinol 1,2-dioxygenase [Burkholderia pseudomallei]